MAILYLYDSHSSSKTDFHNCIHNVILLVKTHAQLFHFHNGLVQCAHVKGYKEQL